MKVSILVTTYNIQDYVDDAIRSVVEQEMPFEWELLIGDDGSSDLTADHIREWIKRYPDNIKLFVHDRGNTNEKIGSRAARNRAFLLEKANGEYIQFLDGDDCFLDKLKIKTQIEILDDSHNSSCACCGHNMSVYVIPTKERYLLTNEPAGDRIYTFEKYWSKHYFSTDTILFRRECKYLLLDKRYRDYLNDNFITFLILQKGSVYYLDKVWAQYNKTGEGLWTGHSRVYGAFRNLQLFDLEIFIRPDAYKLSMSKHRNDIFTIRKSYKRGCEEEIYPLTEGLDKDIFKYTNILYKKSGLSVKERLSKHKLYLTADLSFCRALIRTMIKKIKAKTR